MNTARLQIVGAALLFSTGGAAIKATGYEGFGGSLAVASLRSVIAAAAIALVVRGARRNWSWRTLVVGAAFAATLILFVGANKLTTSANTIFLQSTAPLWIAIAAPFVLRERVRASDVAFMAVLTAGLAMVVAAAPPAVDTAPRPGLGNLLAVLSGVGWAASIMGLRWLGRAQGSDAAAAATVAGNLIAFAVCTPFALGAIATSTRTDWLLVIYLGTVQIALAYILLTRGVRRVGALEVSLLLLVEPVFNPVWTWLVHGEPVSALQVAGGAVILGATALRTWYAGRGTVGGPAG